MGGGLFCDNESPGQNILLEIDFMQATPFTKGD
jgi:hypothetical protein